jgi:predicted DNA-binding transcriptional regulator YafY
VIDLIQSAIRHGRTLGILYRGKARVVDPVGFRGTTLLAWCLHRREFRTFRLDRIEAARVGSKVERYGPEALPGPVEVDDGEQGTGRPDRQVAGDGRPG